MCGRYALYAPASRLQDQFETRIDELPEGFGPRYNAAPVQQLPVIRQRASGERVAHLLSWGLVPSWSKDEAIATKLINARGETLAEKPSFRAAFKARRCIVPASGFFEWKTEDGKKQPYYIQPADDTLLGFAGLWERWQGPAGDTIDTFTIVTTAANEALRPLHDRMPVILKSEDYHHWLTNTTATELVQALVGPSGAIAMCMHPVARDVGNVRRDSPHLIDALPRK